MKSIKSTKAVMALFLIGILMLTIFMQNTVQRIKLTAFTTYDKYWASNTSQSQESSDTKKQVPVSTNIIEEEDKIVEDFESIAAPHHPILITLSYSFPHQFFDEPLLKVVGLPPWA